jgi:3',5'-cyclic AMP phosphodiesterase CpdA
MDYAKLLVLTDIHFVEENADIIGLDPAERFQEVLEHAVAHHGDAERIIITGDLAHHGRRVQYERLQSVLGSVDLPISLMMGNHDRREQFHEVFGGNGFVQGQFDLGDATCLFLDTLDGPPYPKGHHAGLLCEKRLGWLDTQLQTAGDRVLVFMHHPPFATGFDGMDAINLANADAFFDVIKRHGNVEHLICGHVHRTISGHARGVPFTIFKSPCHQMPMMLGEAGTSHSVDEPGAYGIVLVGTDSVVVHSEDVGLHSEITYDPFSN